MPTNNRNLPLKPFKTHAVLVTLEMTKGDILDYMTALEMAINYGPKAHKATYRDLWQALYTAVRA